MVAKLRAKLPSRPNIVEVRGKERKKKKRKKRKGFQGILHEVQEILWRSTTDTDTLYSLTSLITYLPFDLKRKSLHHLFDPRFRRGIRVVIPIYLFVSLHNLFRSCRLIYPFPAFLSSVDMTLSGIRGRWSIMVSLTRSYIHIHICIHIYMYIRVARRFKHNI